MCSWIGRRCVGLMCAALTVVIAHSELSLAEIVPLAADVYSSRSTETADDAADLLRRSREACEAGDVGKSLQLATRVAMTDSAQAVVARRVLGYQLVEDQWAGRYAARRIERGEIWNPRYGWIDAADLSRYEAGQRPLGRRWISVEEDARRHESIDDGWQVRTDHFRVVTNHSREAAAELATRLEMLYQVWQQQFGSFAIKSNDLLKRFDGKQISGYRSKPFEVVYYRTREEYNAALRRKQPRIDMTLGIYFDDLRETHFFAGEDQDPGTIYHEAVHQFFHESRRAARNVGATSNAWLIEGVACYFESLTEHQDADGVSHYTIGTPSAGRLPAARHRLLVNDYYVPLAELSALGIKDFQRRTDLPRLYSQSAGLATFLMQFEQGKYRPALVQAMQLLYAGRDEPSTLADLTGQSFANLDREYRRYLEALPIETSTASP